VKIFATLVEPQSESQIQWGGNDDPNGLLEIGKPYQVDEIEVHSWHTKIILKDFPGKKFNDAGFDYTPKNAGDLARSQWRK